MGVVETTSSQVGFPLVPSSETRLCRSPVHFGLLSSELVDSLSFFSDDHSFLGQVCSRAGGLDDFPGPPGHLLAHPYSSRDQELVRIRSGATGLQLLLPAFQLKSGTLHFTRLDLGLGGQSVSARDSGVGRIPSWGVGSGS